MDMQKTQQTFNEMIESLTGFEEDRVEAHYGRDVYTLLDVNSTKAMRAVIFIDQIREGMKSATADENKVVQAAKKHAQSLTVREVSNYFGDDDEENSDPFGLEGDGSGEPTSESGKGELDGVK